MNFVARENCQRAKNRFACFRLFGGSSNSCAFTILTRSGRWSALCNCPDVFLLLHSTPLQAVIDHCCNAFHPAKRHAFMNPSYIIYMCMCLCRGVANLNNRELRSSREGRQKLSLLAARTEKHRANTILEHESGLRCERFMEFE